MSSGGWLDALPIVCTVEPHPIVLSGGIVLGQPELLPMIRQHLEELTEGYLRTDVLDHGLEQYLAAAALACEADLPGTNRG